MDRRTNDIQRIQSAVGSRKQESEDLRRLIGERISAARRRARLSQGELAERIGTHNWTVSRYETGRMFPHLTLLRRMSTALDVSTDYLLGLDRRPPEGRP
ncbi:MAG TPA: helix-turn-helix transcriptional regulator [Thermoanaerobaculia bacterium]|nr:helix-turn-helix transcriptional regulator [Thermoanaerobaculia bacterium]